MSEENKDPGIPKARILKSQTQKSQPPGSKIPKTKIKICGLSRMEDIEAVNEACPDYCGFIINYPPSKRNISVDQLAELKKILRKEMKAVGVFVDAPAESVAKLLNENLIDLAQLHGNEDETYIANLKKLTAKPLIKAVKVSTEEEVKKAFDTVADEVLLDHGKGTGKTFDWSILKAVPDHRYFLAGGLGTENIKDIDRQKLITMMAGRELKESYPSRISRIGEEALRVEHLTGNGDHDISFTLHRGEILGFAGLVGAGRTELMRVIYGADPIESGKIFVNGKETNIRTCQQAIRHGIGYIPEDRKAHGAFLRMSIKWNVVVNNLRGISKGPFVDEKLENQIAEDYEEKFQIKTPSLEQRVENLSGGNQQKVVIAKTLAANSEIIIFDEPTRGIDVGAKQEIYKLMNQLAGEGKAIIMVSSDMPELLGMSDRIITIYEGRKTGELAKSEFDQNYILDLASGGEEHGKNK